VLRGEPSVNNFVSQRNACRGAGVDFGNRIKALRAEKKLSQRALSALSGVSHSWIGRIERGDFGSLSKPKRIALAQAP
jgi:DNA-binding XRE family transcriptional regulator